MLGHSRPLALMDCPPPEVPHLDFALEAMVCYCAVFLTVLHRLFDPGSDRAAEKWRHGLVIDGVGDLELHQLYRSPMVARVEYCAGRTAVRECLDEIAPDHLQRIEPDGRGDALHQPLKREIDLRPAKAADQPARRLVGQHDAIADRQMANR
jgi:hypothetical protein